MKAAILLLALLGWVKADPITGSLFSNTCPSLTITGDQAAAMITFNQLMDPANEDDFFLYNDRDDGRDYVDHDKSKKWLEQCGKCGNVFEINPDGLGDYNITITQKSNKDGVAVFDIAATIIPLAIVKPITDTISGLGLGLNLSPVTSLVGVPLFGQLKFTFANGKLDTELVNCSVVTSSLANLSSVCVAIWNNHLCNRIAKNMASEMSSGP